MKLIKELDVINYVPVRMRKCIPPIQDNLRECVINLPIFGEFLFHEDRFWCEIEFVKQVDDEIKK